MFLKIELIMETLEFKIKLLLSDNDNKISVDSIKDEISDLKLKIEFSWLGIGNDKVMQNMYKLYYGYCDDDFDMTVKYHEDGYIYVTLTTDDSFNKHIAALYGNMNVMQLTVRPLISWLKIALNEKISDVNGTFDYNIGTCKWNGKTYELIFGEIISDEPVNNGLFTISEPVYKETDPEIIKKYMLPDYADKYDEITEKIKNGIDIPASVTVGLHKLYNENISHMVQSLKGFKK